MPPPSSAESESAWETNFEPSAERGAALDQRVRERLADTLDYVFAEVGKALGVDRKAAARLSSQIRRQRQSPHMFGAYFEMVLQIEDDDLEQARHLAREIITREPLAGTHISAIDHRAPGEAARYRRLLVEDPNMALQPGDALLAQTTDRIKAAFDLLDRGFPEMAAEIRELLAEIVIAAGPTDPLALTFDGASSYMLWGAILLNARGQNNVLDTAQALAHESGHNLLFGFCASGPLIENTDDEMFSSPLRTDPRPMDGVVHATYVVSRMHQTISRLLDAGVLSETEQAAALDDLAAHRRNFAAGDQVIRDGGRLTRLGNVLIDSARAYMATA
jgi:HEXXH motif-containing protein